MSDLINRQAALDVLCDACGNCACPKGKIPRCSYYEKMQAIPAASPWHRVEDELPPNAKHPGAFCPKVRVMTRWGVTDGWFNPDMGRNGLWCVLLWFFMGTWKEDDIDFERGDRPKMVWLSQDDVIAWMPIEPPEEDA